jgi:8-oxo-dGDP phosphatase
VPDDTQPAFTPTPGPALGGERREHHMRLLPRCYRQMESGRKTIEVRVATPQKRAIAVGDPVVFHDRDNDRELDVIVQRITRYASFEDLIRSEDPARIDPDGPRGELLANLRRIYPPAKEALGALAFEFDHRPARLGRPLPMTPTQYARTVPHHTVYGCLYVRDEDDRPVQLRSVYGSRLWQFPGGNLDAQGEDPLQTARREGVEETGLDTLPGEGSRPRGGERAGSVPPGVHGRGTGCPALAERQAGVVPNAAPAPGGEFTTARGRESAVLTGADADGGSDAA